MEAATRPDERITAAELREAEKRLIGFLHSKRFPRDWIERHVPEVMSQAHADFAARLAAGREDETVNLLVIIGYRRALKVLRGDHCGPPTTPLETIFHVADESTPTPEEEAIKHDREERVLKAMSHLPEREQKLLSFIYSEGLSIRQAGLRVGWQNSAAKRHHRAALERLEAMLDRSLLAPEIALPAYLATRQDSLWRAVVSWIEGATETVREAATLISGRAIPAAEAGNAAAMSGTGRAAAGVCGVAVAACLASAATGVVGPGVGALAPVTEAAKEGPGVQRAQSASAANPISAPPALTGPQRLQRRGSGAGAQGSRGEAPTRDPHAAPERRERADGAAQTAPTASAKQTVNEFGVEGGEVEPSAPASSEPVKAAPIAAEPPPAARPQVESSPSGGSSGSSSGGGSSSAGSGASSEFGM